MAIQDQDSFNTPGGYRDDPEWQQEEEDRPDEDPLPGEEFKEEPHLNNCLDPNTGFLDGYRLGVDGVALVNAGGKFACRLDPTRSVLSIQQNTTRDFWNATGWGQMAFAW